MEGGTSSVGKSIPTKELYSINLSKYDLTENQIPTIEFKSR